VTGECPDYVVMHKFESKIVENFTRITITTISTVSAAAAVVVVTTGAGIPASTMSIATVAIIGMISVELTEPYKLCAFLDTLTL
jgi:phosphate/sulfate permease